MNNSQERILLVESDPEVSDLIGRQSLRPLGYQVQVVGAAPSAIQEAVRFAPDVILANLNLPGLSGKDLLVALSSQGLDVPVIVIAGKGMEGDVIQAFRLGAADFLNTPIREAEVVSAVERALKQVRARREREQLASQLKQTNLELQRRVRELTTIFAIGKAVISATDQQALFDTILEGAVYVTEADIGWFLVREERGKSFILRAFRNLPESVAAKINQPWDDGLSSLVALSGESLSIHGDPLKRFKVAQLGQSALVVPVKVKKEVAGLLVVVRKKKQPFGSSHQTLLEAVADYASISLVNARLFMALQERIQTLQQSSESIKVNECIKGEILEQVSQELRSLLTVAKGNVDLLVSLQMGKLTAEQTSALITVQEKMDNILNIVDILTTIQPNDTPGQHLKTNLNELTRQAIGRFQPIARQSAATLFAELPSKPVTASANTFQIAQVLDGLLSNAVKYSPQGGRITIRVERMDGDRAHVTVQDSGIGIEAKHLPKIFDKAYVVETSSPQSYGGVGIHLHLIKDIISAHSGRIWCESRPNEGSTFHFTLPLSDK